MVVYAATDAWADAAADARANTEADAAAVAGTAHVRTGAAFHAGACSTNTLAPTGSGAGRGGVPGDAARLCFRPR